jgi:glycosyltransferase involved in cell wall biosynthesis
MLDPSWISANAESFDVMHIHFGFDALTPHQLRDIVGALRHHRKPLVVTVHDLRNPHHPEPALHDRQLEVLVTAADALITLTPGAAAMLARRWGRDATVLPHPHVVPRAWLSRPRPNHEGFVIGVHAKSLRASFDPLPVVECIVEALPEIPGARLRVDAHTDVVTPTYDRYEPLLAGRLRDLARDGLLELRVHDYFTDEELWAYLQGLDVSVLPYRFGSHSGWLEACHDLGTTVIAPDCGFYAEQRPCLLYSAEPFRRRSTLQEALRQAVAQNPGPRATPGRRDEERLRLARAHRRIYDSVLSQRVPCTS